MERDFMGLNSKDSVVAVKEEVSDELKDSAPTKAYGTPWPFDNKVSALPHLMRLIPANEDGANRAAPSPVSSSGFAQNFAGFLAKSSHAPSAASIAGLADPCWNKSAASTAHAQMTIFYNGTVKVYDSITPEKAQAVLFLAGNGSCLFTSGAQVRPPTPKVGATDVLPANQVINAQPSSTISSPISVSSHNGAQSVSGSTSTDVLMNYKPVAIPFAPDCKMDPPKPILALGSAIPTSLIPRGIPQSRKVSLARFLEKRKERAMNAAPYNGAKKPECAT